MVETAALAQRNARLHAKLRHAAERDPLTGLKNRRMYRKESAALLATATADAPVAMAVIDLDDFKAINYEHGHEVGDRVLVHAADRLRRSLREDDAVYRLGGEEFAVVMPGADAAAAARIADRIRRSMRATRTDLPATTVSIGLAVAPDHGAHLDTIFRAADRALYDAKTHGKNRVRTIQP